MAIDSKQKFVCSYVIVKLFLSLLGYVCETAILLLLSYMLVWCM